MMAASLLAALLAGDVVSWTTGLRTESRTRTAAPGAQQGPLPLELAVDPAAGLSAVSDTLRGAIEYQPHLGVQQADGKQRATVLHRLAATSELRVDRRTRVAFEERLSLGENNFTPLASAATGPPDPRVPQQAFVARYLQQSALLTLETVVARGARAGTSLGYQADGGLGAQSRKLIPVLQGPRAAAFFSSALSRLTTANAGLDVAYASSTAGSRAVIASASGTLEHAFDRRVRGSLTLGAAGAGGSASAAQAFPVAALSLEGSVPLRGQALSGALHVSARPTADRYTGGAYERLEVSATGDFRALEALSFGARASGGAVVSGPARGQSIGQGELSGTLSARRGLAFTAGCRLAWTQPVAGQPGGAALSAFALAQVATAGVF